MQTTTPLAQTEQTPATVQATPATAYTHQPRPPQVQPGHLTVRYFAHGKPRWDMQLQDGTHLRVLRYACRTTAHVIVEQSHGMSSFELRLQLDAAGLRDLAARLLDAAHDIETVPALVEGGAA